MTIPAATEHAPAAMPWHALAAAEVLARLETTSGGLPEAVAAERLRRVGANVLPRRQRPSLVRVYLRQFQSPLIYLLLAAAAVSLAIGELSDAGFIFAVLQLNAVIGAAQEWRAEGSAEALDRLIRNRVMVRRDGGRREVDSADLVPGDVVDLESGSLVPADLRLLATRDARADESLLTGESLPVAKEAGAEVAADAVIGDRGSMLYAGSTLVSGRAEGVVTATARGTELGRIAEALVVTPGAPPPLVVRLERFTRVIAISIMIAVTVMGAAELVRGTGPVEVFLVAVALAVSAIPEGLPVAITVALSVASARMARRNVVVRSLPAVEGLGACTLIASDKTGTLTCNELTVVRLFVPGVGELAVEGEGYSPEGRVVMPVDAPAATLAGVWRLATAGALCNEAVLSRADAGWRHFGDTVDVAFLALAGKLGLSRDSLIDDHPEIGAIPFEPARRYAATFNRVGDGVVAHVKGAAEAVVPMCGGDEARLAEAERLAAEGFRVLAVAAGRVPEAVVAAGAEAGLSGLELLGFVALIDPLRPEVPDAVRVCRRAGVDVRMVTGDHPVTALAIARGIGIATAAGEVVTGAALARISADPAALDAVVASARVFARVEPVQKLAIVQSLQRLGHFVAVTGDGVNDAPALQAAHIGVAMGRGGTDVARGAADLILTDDNFASIVGGVEEGRVAYDNVRKVTYLMISCGVAEILLFFLAQIADLPLPMFAVQLLWLNLVTNGIQDAGLAFEKGEPGILRRKPRPPDQRIFDRRMIEQTVISGLFMGAVCYGYFHWMLSQGMDEVAARNALLLLMVLFEGAHVFNCRSETRSVFSVPLAANPFVVVGAASAILLHVGAMVTPGFSGVLHVHPVALSTWLETVPLALSLIVVMELYKIHRRRITAA